MRVMVMVKATADSEANVMPDTAMLTAMGKFNEELVKAGDHAGRRRAAPYFERKTRPVFGQTSVPLSTGRSPKPRNWSRVSGCGRSSRWKRRSNGSGAARIPMAGDSDIEIRPVFEMEDFGAEFTAELREQEERVGAQAEKLAKDARH